MRLVTRVPQPESLTPSPSTYQTPRLATSEMTPAFEYFEFDPAPALARHVTSYWGFRILVPDPPVHRIWPDGCIVLAAVSMPSGAHWSLVGPRMGPLDVPVQPAAEGPPSF